MQLDGAWWSVGQAPLQYSDSKKGFSLPEMRQPGSPAHGSGFALMPCCGFDEGSE